MTDPADLPEAQSVRAGLKWLWLSRRPVRPGSIPGLADEGALARSARYARVVRLAGPRYGLGHCHCKEPDPTCLGNLSRLIGQPRSVREFHSSIGYAHRSAEVSPV